MFDLPPLFAHLVELVTIFAINVVAIGVGIAILRLLRAASLLTTGERLVFGMGLGYGALSFLMFGMGVLHLLYLPVGLLVLLALAVIAARELFSLRVQTGSLLARSLRALRYLSNLFLALICLVAVLAALAKALVPPATQDDLMYHLALPRLYIETHALTFAPDSDYSLFPQLMELLYTWGLLLGSDRLPVLFAFSTGLLCVAAAAVVARRLLQPEGATGLWRSFPLLVGAIFLSSPLVGFVLRAANTDFAQATFDLLGIYAFVLGVGGRGSEAGKQEAVAPNPQLPIPDPRLLALSGLCAGLSFSVKYYGVTVPFFVGLALLVVLLVRWRRSRIRFGAGIIVPLVYFLAPVALLVAPWLVRNYVASGNPVWPAAGNILGGAYWSPAADPSVLLGTIPGLSLNSLWTGLQYDWNAISRGPLLIDNQQHVVSVGPLLVFALLALPLARWRPGLRWLFYFAATLWVFSLFFFSRASIRYLATLFLVFAIIGAYALISTALLNGVVRWLLGGVVALALLVLAVDTALSTGIYLPTTLALDRSAEQSYLASYMEDYQVIKYIEQNAAPNAGVYVWDSRPRGYLIPRPYVYGRLVPKYSGVSDDLTSWRGRLRELGMEYVLVHTRLVLAPTYPPGFDPDAALFESFRKQYLGDPLLTIPDTSEGSYTLYRLHH